MTPLVVSAIGTSMVLAQATSITTGKLVENVACASDPTQTYTLYLPSTYTPQRRWPSLFVFDPRGRGTMAAGIFQEAAERFGWIVASSDNTRSDGPWEPNRRAIVAMWPDVLTRFAVDERRIYAAGFSGGAGVATVLAQSTGHVAGIIAAGAPDPGDGERAPAVAWFGAAGRFDFNYLSAKSFGVRKAGNPRRVEFFDGVHQWLPAAMAMRAAGWFEALAMKDGRRARDEILAGQLRDADLATAGSLEAEGRLVEAERLYASVSETYAGLIDVSGADAKRKGLEADRRLGDVRREEQKADADERGRENQLPTVLGTLRADEIPMLRVLLAKLRIEPLKRDAVGSGTRAESARRSLELIFVQTSFYLWREFEEKKDYGRAVLCLEIAAAIHTDRPRVWYDLAGDRAALRDHRGALAALGRAIDHGFADREQLESDERFATLRRHSEYAPIIARMKSDSD